MNIVKVKKANGEQVAPQTTADAVIFGNGVLSEKISDSYIVVKDSTLDKYWKIVVTGGILGLTEFAPPSPVAYRNALIIGNSITLHPIASYWWGKWGMAATSRNDDWVHKFKSGLVLRNENAKCYAINVADTFERSGTSDIASIIESSTLSIRDFDSINLGDVDLVIIRIGENGLIKSSLEGLVDSIRANCANGVKIVISGMFWPDSTKEQILSSVAESKGCSYKSIASASSYRSSIGTIVQGDDGQTHEIDNQGVADHPSDAGMLIIANELLNAIGYDPVE